MSNVTVIVGLQWGNEGKGRIAHHVSRDCIAIRATGSSSAGHTVMIGGQKFTLHLLPAAIVLPFTKCIIGPGVVIDLPSLATEIRTLQAMGIKVSPERLIISPRAHIILPYHVSMDKMHEKLKGSKKLGTTLSGVGPCYSDKVNRVGIRMQDFAELSIKELMEKISHNLKLDNVLLEAFSPEDAIKQLHTIIDENILSYRSLITPYIHDEHSVVIPALCKGSKIVVEGSQSFYLDIDQGDYPYVTSSSPSTSGTLAAAGIGPIYVNNVLGVAKAYCSRVGEGPFNTEEFGTTARVIRELGHEYSAYGKARRCGWLDLVRLRNAIIIDGITELCLMHMDTLGKIGQKLGEVKVCTSYLLNDKNSCWPMTVDYFPMDTENCEPIYKSFVGGWNTSGCTSYASLPKAAKEFVEYVEEYTGVPVKYIGIGPDVRNTIVR